MNFKANATFKPGNANIVEQRIVPAVTRAMQDATGLVESSMRDYVPVDTGELKASIGSEVKLEGSQVTGTVHADAEHAAYVEFGTGQRGASSPGAGKGISYSSTWKGMKAQPFCRPALDANHNGIIATFNGIKI